MRCIVINLIKSWRNFIYPTIKPIFPSSCRFTPTCSEYTIQSIEKFGIIKGSRLGFIQILKCNPWFNS